MKIRDCSSDFVLVAERKSRELNLQLIDSSVDPQITYMNDDEEVMFYRRSIGIQIPIKDMPLYKDTIVDIYNAVMQRREAHKFYIKEGLKDKVAEEWMQVYEMYQWQKLNMIDTFGYGRRTGEKNG